MSKQLSLKKKVFLHESRLFQMSFNSYYLFLKTIDPLVICLMELQKNFII